MPALPRPVPSPVIVALALCAAVAPVGHAGPASAQCLLCARPDAPDRASQLAEQPLRITIETNLDFSRIANAGGGSIDINPTSGTRSMSGRASDLGGMPVRGQVRIEGTPGRGIRVDLPQQVELVAASGLRATVVNLRTDLPAAPRLGADGSLSFAFGGELRLPPGISGELRGRIPITVSYL